ncbi:unnamed protein product [Didymodactylos carnosus]|uniref:Homeobox domain-containing protein n=1 Tax=Didymodactylos carnosus TaxID=1234261 RepID=A0A814KDR5_9BILA|nr:unnamed protein product [Didymodactylos carnosus]CAF3819321.1 unnamed protein product [Didymodactylos carnosus]
MFNSYICVREKKIMNGIKTEEQCYDSRNNSLPLSASSMELNETTTTEEDDEDEIDETTNELLKKTHDSGFVDASDEKEVTKVIRSYSNYTSTPLRPVTNNIREHIGESSSIIERHLSSDDTKFDDGKNCRNTRFLGSKAVAILDKWFHSNRDYPYPDDEKTEQLAFEAGITSKQVKKWFANKRVRSQSCYKPLYRSRKSRINSYQPTSAHIRPPILPPPTNYNYIINHNNIAPQSQQSASTFQNIVASSHPSQMPAWPLSFSPHQQYPFPNPFFNPMLMNPFTMMIMMNPLYAQQLLSTMASNGSILSAPTSQSPVQTTQAKQPQSSTPNTSSTTTSGKSRRFWM